MALDIPQPMFDPRLLEQYRALMEPPPEARKQAGMDSLLALGLGLLANRGPHLGPALGNAGFAAMGTYRDRMDSARQNRMGEIQGAMGLRKLQQEMETDDALNKYSENYIASLPPEKQDAARLAYKTNRQEFGKMLTAQFGPQKYNAPTQVSTPQGPRFAFPSEAGEFKVTDQIPFREAPAPKDEYKYNQLTNAWDFDPVAYSRDLTKRASGAARVSNIQVGEKAATKAFAEADAASVTKSMEKAKEMRALLPKIDRMIMLSKDGQTYSGWGANVRTDLANLSQFFGSRVDVEKLANSEEYFAQNAEVVRQGLKAIGGNDSNTDLLFSQKSSADLSRSPQGRRQILKALRADIAATVEEANRANDEVRGSWGVPRNPRILTPVPPPPDDETERGKLRFQQYLDKGR